MKGVGIQEYLQLKSTEELANGLGFKFSHSPFGNDNRIVLQPLEDKWPAYARDANIFLGDMDEIVAFLRGIEASRQYYQLIKVFDAATLERAEQDIRNQDLIDRLSEDKVEEEDPEDDIPF